MPLPVETSSIEMATFVYFILPIILLMLGLPIFVVLLLTSLTAILFVAHLPTDAVQTYMFASLDNFPLLAVPFFVLAGEIMGKGGIANRVVNWVVSIIGGVRGSLAMTTVASSELFGAMAHTSVGTVVAIGRLLFPSLTSHGYSERFAISLITSSGAVAAIIPPSIAMILYAMTAQVSAIKLFTAGILPSLLIGLVDAVYVMVYARIKMVPLSAAARWKNIWASTKDASWAIGTIVVIFGGIYGGIFTPTEAAGVAVVYSLFVAMVVYRTVGLFELWEIIVSSVVLIGQILIIVTAAGVYSWLMTTSGIPRNLIHSVEAMQLPHWETLLLVNAGLLFAGSFLEPAPAILIFTPLLLPVVESAGIDALHFGVVMAVNLSIGLYMPPFGLNLFAARAVFNVPMGVIYRGVLPFVVVNFLTLSLITYVPEISTAFLGSHR
jgi:C4-dicarboxylate transporter DctM subunit